jgi:hypothetical protein
MTAVISAVCESQSCTARSIAVKASGHLVDPPDSAWRTLVERQHTRCVDGPARPSLWRRNMEALKSILVDVDDNSSVK